MGIAGITVGPKMDTLYSCGMFLCSFSSFLVFSVKPYEVVRCFESFVVLKKLSLLYIQVSLCFVLGYLNPERGKLLVFLPLFCCFETLFAMVR